jgi:hypothetical protein
MLLTEIKLSKAELDTLPEAEQVFFVQIMHFLNELNILQKCVIVSNNRLEDSLSRIEKRSQIAQAQFFIRILAGKLYEGWEMIKENFFKTGISKKYESLLSKKGKENLSELKNYFNNKSNTIRLIRKKFAFHYDREMVKEQIKKIPKAEKLEIYMSENSANCLFSIGDIVINWAILNSIDSSNPEKAMKILIGEVAIKVSRLFQGFCHDYITIVAKQLKLDFNDVKIDDPKSIYEIELPYFITRS